MIRNNSILLLITFIYASIATAQDAAIKAITLNQVYKYAQQNYPLVKDGNLINEIERLHLEVIKKSKLPSVSLNGNAQVQSENISLNLGTASIEAPLETYNAYLYAEYNIYDGGKTSAETRIQKAKSSVDRNAFEVQFRLIKNRVNTLLFAISISRKQKYILETSKLDLETNISTLEIGFKNGTILESEVSKLKVRRLEIISNIIQLNGKFSSYLVMLEQLTGKTFSNNVQFEIPVVPSNFTSSEINRPELELFNSQKSLLEAQEASITASLKPKISLFAQGGVGNPNPLNFADFNLAPYALGGVKLKWNFINFGKSKKEKELLKIQQDQIEIDREVFSFDIQSEAKEYTKRIESLVLEIENNETIVQLQKEILQQSKVQLDNGIINSSEYVTQLNAAIQSEQNLELNRVELQQATIEYLTLIGKL
ncbi:TolC family protein [Kordia jejudonensis]|uniref:TolC family protein n=1 Tax=Kordia jejudonensis TaxID=1348245 RepID=UPI0006296BFD|nr:TolC family protein [Kordia jejudonensis]